MAPLKTTLKYQSASSAAQPSHSSLHKQGQEHGHAYTSPSVILLLCPPCHLLTHYCLSSIPAPPPRPPAHLHPCSTAHKHSVIPVVITVGHNFRDNLKTIYYPWSITKKKKTGDKHFLNIHLKPIDIFINGSLR